MHTNALKVQLYFEDLETTNNLGSKTKIHKMGAVYFSLRSLPPEYNSGLDRETYVFGICEPLLDVIRLIECHDIEIEVSEENHTYFMEQCACLQVGLFKKAFLRTSFVILALLVKIVHKRYVMKMSLKGETETTPAACWFK